MWRRQRLGPGETTSTRTRVLVPQITPLVHSHDHAVYTIGEIKDKPHNAPEEECEDRDNCMQRVIRTFPSSEYSPEF